LQVKVTAPMDEVTLALEKLLIKNPASIFTKHYREAIADSLKRLIYPSLEREIRSELTAKGEEQAISIFSKNLRQLLLQPPVKGKMVLAIDPGYRTGCKLAVVDETGKLLTTGTIYPHQPQNQREQAKNTLHSLVQQYGADIIAVGNGTASRETEALVAELIGEQKLSVQYIIVSEAGASVYSASPLAREEFPEFDVSLRSAVSIARRLQDPLAELVKIEPKAVGVGQYQHDVTPKRLEESLGGVVEDCVNQVGVDLNTASASLLSYVAGLTMAVAKKIVAFREEKGKFRTRTDLLKVPRLGEKTFVQCAGFLRLPEGDNYLENTPVHPESYELAQGVLKLGNCSMMDLRENLLKVREELNKLIPEQVATRLEAGLPTVRDIINALLKPGRDPRDELPKPLLRSDITTIENLSVGMVLWGTVRNVVDFGAFIDIGLKQDGLVHISQLADKYVKNPMEVVSVGDIVKVRITNIDKARERIGLSMREEVV
ncbi:MAG: helix-hairpin-helix domain-containing protein, partial [Clostridia bacterium]|nr:helix-hairpin-helix domain-containing protein [Clostridia bacterium]